VAEQQQQRAATRSGPGRLLIAVYAIFALAATARSAVQIATKFSDAPLAYVLSAVAAVVYIVATVCFTRGSRTSRQVATVSCTVELIGVLAVGTASVLAPSAFPDQTVWSVYGDGYGFIPVVLPILGLLWIRRSAKVPVQV
jgi:cytochrome bd-type quinol oxidase subunit 2